MYPDLQLQMHLQVSVNKLPTPTMPPFSCYFLHIIVIFLSFAPLTFSSSAREDPKTFIILTSKSQKPNHFACHHDWYSAIMNSLPPSPHPVKILYTYSHATNGFSAQLTPSQAAIIQRVPGVISVIPDEIRQLHTTHTPQFLGLSSAHGLWPNGAYGDDIIIGVLDTGIWPEHPSFSDAGLGPVPNGWKGICETSAGFPVGSCNKKVIGARAFSAGIVAFQGSELDLSQNSLSPLDTDGHGTHCASTAAGALVRNASFFQYAQGRAIGVAPRARIAAYKICWSNGCSDADMLAGFEQAILDGVHVISFSVAKSTATEYFRDSIAIGAYGATKNGIVVSTIAGNNGSTLSTVANIAPWILTVGASTVDREFPADVVLGDNSVFGGVSLYSGEPQINDMLPVIDAADAGDRYCNVGGLSPSRVRGNIVVCDGRSNSWDEKGRAVKQAGGLAMILVNFGDVSLATYSHYVIPATVVDSISGSWITSYIRSTSFPTATIVFRGTVISRSPSAPRVASFSSRGPNPLTPELLKPDVIAPGVNILAAWTGVNSPTKSPNDPRRVQFNIISGTSMACPHVSGIAALLRKAYPNWSPAAIKSALITTAYNLDNSGQTIIDSATGRESTPLDRGAGHVDPNRSLDPGLVYDMETSDYIAFLCSIGYDASQIAVFEDNVTPDVCDNNKGSPGNLNYASFSVVFWPNSNVVTYKRVVKNVGKSANAVYDVNVNAPEGVIVNVWPRRLVFSSSQQRLSYEITFSSHFWPTPVASFGSIEWSDGTHSVRSPIAVMWARGFSESVVAM